MHERFARGVLAAVLASSCAPASSPRTSPPVDPSTTSCAALSNVELAGGRIVSAELVASGELKVAPSPIAPDLAQRVARLPAFCRVQLVATPTSDSHIAIEVWLPLHAWNGRLLGTGNGGGAGRIAYEMGMVEGLQRGFAVANTDMGTAPDINATVGHPERTIDFGHRATHEMTRAAKAMVADFYKVSSFRSYFAGCFTGGQQGLANAQRYPDDYDGILAGAPGNNRTHVANYFLWNYRALNATPAAKLTQGQWSTVSRAVLSSCAGKDGGAPGDRFLTDPRRCRFEPATVPVCAANAPTDDCLTAVQLATVRQLYAGPVNPRTGERIFAGLTPGSEDQPLGPVMQGDPAIWPDQQFFPFRWKFGSSFEPTAYDFDRDLDRLDAELASTLNANSADLSSFARRGGKLLLYTGTADPAVPFAGVVDYYDRVTASKHGDLARLFLVPGMGHCFGGPGVTDLGQPFTSDVPSSPENDALMTLVNWTEGGPPPSVLVARTRATGGAVTHERPVCAYPALPEYRGGDATKRSSFVCTDHPRGTEQSPAPRYLN